MKLQASETLCLVVFFSVGIAVAMPPESDPIVTTSLGKIRGTCLKSSTGKAFYAFRGIRYAKPPINELRFKAPQPADKWNGIFDATKDGPRCPQPTANLSDISEDCLRINVYTHNLPSEGSGNVRKPVIVYLHSGGFYVGSGQSWNFAGPLYFMDRDIVFVTLNYRLGILGFLSTGTAEAPGNAGLKDQVMALKWIQSHIADFGGDPNSVTLFGYSAGARSITMHLISPMSRNLFHRAILMSGSTTTAQWEVPPNQLDLAKRQARLLNCGDENIKEMVDCLKTKSAVDFGKSLRDMFEFGNGNPVVLFKPVVEPDFGQERFLTETPTKVYQRGDFMRIPLICGINKDEFAVLAIVTLRNDTLRNQLDTDFNTWAPVNFLYERNTKRSNEISKKLREFYLGDGPLSLEKSLDGLGKLYADSLIGFQMHRFIHLVAPFTKIYQYRFTYQGRYSHTYYPDNKTPFGVVHHDDLLYLLTLPSIAPVFTEKDPERKTMERLTRMWTNFAHTSDPNDPSDEYLRSTEWIPFDSDHERYLNIGENLEMKQHLQSDRFNVWDNLFPLH
ncbi:unnamed protein product [Hermetia illucens]|uniref:Carboxylic ester hydrolase n=1 Tax=Hermetia illucens TaxID=343691 RepID=A0A7R8UTT9_HERIL|nr:esterase FE4-like [Hermetia illucens]CAD7085838.1 unnamed protein product [Hermetia illucens]